MSLVTEEEAGGYLSRAVGANLRAYRYEHGLSQAECARVLGIHPVYLAKVERGMRNLSLRTVERFAQRLGYESADLLRSPTHL